MLRSISKFNTVLYDDDDDDDDSIVHARTDRCKLQKHVTDVECGEGKMIDLYKLGP